MDLMHKFYKTASCPALGYWAISKGYDVKWGNAKRGDIVLFDFNRNKTSDHVGIVTKVTSGYIETIEGNTGNGSNTNGDGVYRRTRYKHEVNFFVRPPFSDTEKEGIIKAAESQLGYKEGINNNNKYGKWFGCNYEPWCACFVCWCVAHAKSVKPTLHYPRHSGLYTGIIPKPTLRKGDKSVSSLRKFLNWYCGCKLAEDGDYNEYVIKWVKVFQRAEGFKNPSGIWGEFSYKHAVKYKKGKKPYPYTMPYLPYAIERKAVEYAYKYGTPLSAYRYKGGHAKESYRNALPKLFDRSGWGTKAKYGASCDVFVSACCRASGEAKDMPRGLKGQKPYIPKHFEKIKSRQHGAIGWKSNHVLIYVGLKGKLYVANAHHNKSGGTYGIIEGNRKMSKYYRPHKLTDLRKGDSFTPVIYLQRFLKWYGEDCKADGYFGYKTETALMNFQYHEGLTVDGICGSKTISRIKAVKR